MSFNINSKVFPSISDLNLSKKVVFLRADLNIPLQEGKIVQDFKLKSIFPTIDFILKSGGKIVLATHIGRPAQYSPPYSYIEELSTKHLIPALSQNGYKVELVSDLDEAPNKIKDSQNFIILLENLRFFAEEQQQSEIFAKKLSALADIYINDSFGSIHRNDTSTTLLPKLFKPGCRSFGLLVEKEIKELSKIKDNPKKPFLVICGGEKVEGKLDFLSALISKEDKLRPNEILLTGVIGNTFLAAQGIEMGMSKIEKAAFAKILKFLELAHAQNVKIQLPKDGLLYFEAEKDEKTKVFHVGHFLPNTNCVDIGPLTIETFGKKIEEAKTIFLNGTAGIYTKEEFSAGTKEILAKIGHSHAFSVIGGGDATAAAFLLNEYSHIDFLSTGGGATLAFLSEKAENLPAISAFLVENQRILS